MSEWISLDDKVPSDNLTYPVNFIIVRGYKGMQAYNGPHIGFYRERRNGEYVFDDTNDDVHVGVTHWAEIERPPLSQTTKED